jgi:phasin
MKTPQFEISPDMRTMAERSVEQARTAFNTYMSAAQGAAQSVEGRTKAAQAGAQDVTKKAIGYAEQNVAAAFAFAQQVVHARDLQDFVRLQNEFIQAQMRALTEQAKDLGQTASNAAMGMAKPPS